MPKFVSLVFSFLLLILFLITPKPVQAIDYDLTGQWNWTDYKRDQSWSGVAEINHEGDTFTFTWRWPTYWIGAGSTSGSSLTLVANYTAGYLTAQWFGTITNNGNRIEGTWIQSDGQFGTFVATKIGPLSSPFPSPTPSPSPSPSPSPIVTPFLDLPWDYEGKGLSFNEAALAINSFFDHKYPLLWFFNPDTKQCHPAPDELPTLTLTFRNIEASQPELFYSCHDGYDYGKSAKANINEPVLAAADGCASYKSTPAGGHIIMIDHGNGYQSRYLHLQDDSFLVTKSPTCVDVTQGQRIGSVGYSGNVKPKGEDGAHIHFMVIQDKDGDGDFDDNMPDGLVDPFGWQSSEPDPWPNFTWQIGEQNFSGNTSYYLWTKAIANLSDQLTSNGGFFELERYKLDFPQGATNETVNLEMQSSPVAKPSGILESIGSTLTILAKDLFGNPVTGFIKPFDLTVDFSAFDTSKYDTNTISIYSSEDGTNWTKEGTTIDPIAKTASAELNHLTHFALMAERLDTIAPTTTANLSGGQGQANWFRSGVQMTLDAQDNEGGLGVDYTLYKTDEDDWQEYNSQILLTNEGHHIVDFYSVDNDENIEEIKTIEFNIDKTPPLATVDANPNILWPPNGKMVDVTITGSATDDASYIIIQVDDEYGLVEPPISGFGQNIKLQANRREEDKDGRKYIIKVLDFAGNESINTAEVTVPHDQGG